MKEKLSGWRLLGVWIAVWLAGMLLMVGLVSLALALSALISCSS